MANTLNLGNGNWATKEDSLLAYNSENGNFKPLPFDFTRASSATVVNKAGLIETVGSGEPRIDFSNDAKGALLLEPTRLQLLPYSEDFTNAAWVKTNVTLTSSNVISPDGTQNASKIEATASDSSLQDSITVTSGTTYTLSVYLKTVSGTLDTAIGLGSPGFPQNEGEGGRYKNITVTNEWKRYTLTSTADASAATGIGVGGFNSFSTGEEVYVWGAQLEQGSYATSYIPNFGNSAGATRSADVCNNGGNEQVINSTEGVLYVEANLIDGYDNNNFLATIFDNSNGGNNHVIIQRYLGNIQSKIKVGTTQAEITESNTTSGNKKIAFTYKANEFKMFVNGSQVGLTDTSGSVFSPNTLDKINVGSYYNSTLSFNNGVKDLRVYNTALTDAELQALTK